MASAADGHVSRKMAECFLAASSSLGVAQLCDARTGAVVRTLKDCHAARAGLLATSHFALAAESTRSYLHMWVWSRDQPQYRCQAPERVHCVVCSEDAAYCVGGAASGRLYLWSVPTGRLLYAWDAHFRACSAVEFAADGGFVVSAGEDAVVHAWNMAALLHAAATAAAAPRAYRTWTEHTLPVCALCTSPCGQHGLIGSASLDHTVKLWRLAEGVVGSVHSWPLDAPLSAIAAHPAHVALYAGTADGHVHALHLQARASAGAASVAVLDAATAAGGTAASELTPRPQIHSSHIPNSVAPTRPPRPPPPRVTPAPSCPSALALTARGSSRWELRAVFGRGMRGRCWSSRASYQARSPLGVPALSCPCCPGESPRRCAGHRCEG